MKVHNLLVTGSLTSVGEDITRISSSVTTTITNLSSSLTSSMGGLSSSMVVMITDMSSSMNTSITNLSSSMVSVMATTGSNLFKGNQTISGSIIPSVDNTYDLGSSTHQFRDLYLSSASLYIDGTKVLSSTTQELQITTDTGQSFKILEAGSDTITLQSADGNITLASSGGGDVILDPTTGIIALKGTTTVYAGNRILSSDGNAIHFGNSVTMTGSLIVTGFIETQELRTTYISSSILYRSGSTKFGDELTDTHAFSGSVLISGSISVPDSGLVSGSAQITYSGLSGVPSGIISGSAQLPSGVVSGSSQVLSGTGIWSGSAQLPSGVVSGSAQITLSSTTGYGSVLNQAVLTTSSPTFAGLTNNGTYSQTTTSTQPVMIYGDSAGSNGLFRIQIDEVNDSFGTGTRTYLGDGGNDIFIGTSNSSYTPSNTYIALNHSGEISMGAGSATKHFILSTSGDATFTGTGTFSGGGNTLTLKKGTGSPAIAFAGTSDQATGLIEGVSGGGVRIYTSTGTLSSPSWSQKVLISSTGTATFTCSNSYTTTTDNNIRLTNNGYRADDLSSYSEGGYLDFYFENYNDAYGGTVYDRVLDIVVKGSPDGTYGKGVIRFKANPKTVGSNSTEIMRIQGDNKVIVNGNIGINVTNPTQKLEIGNGNLRLTEIGTSSFDISYSGGKVQFGTDSAGTQGFYFRTYSGSYADRFIIKASGEVNVAGSILPTSDATHNLGSTSLRWNNLYTTDLHLSNEGKQNVVDGTWGDWTLQEGENDIFMLNNRSGEKFKIKLEKIIQ